MSLSLINIKNLSIGKKLFSGFILLIIIIVFTSLFSVNSLKNIDNSALKTTSANKIGNLLDSAIRDRMTFMYTGDVKAIEKNGAAIKQMQEIIHQDANLDWSGNTQEIFSAMTKDVNDYSVLRDLFFSKNRERELKVKSVSQSESLDVLNTLQNKLSEGALDRDSLVKAYDLLNSFSALRESANVLTSLHTDDSYKSFEQAYQKTEALYIKQSTQLSDSSKELLQPVWDYFRQFKINGDAYFSAAVESRNSAAKMGVVANDLQKNVTNLISAQDAINKQVIGKSIIIVLSFSVIATLVGLLVSSFITRQITRPIKENLTLAEHITSGDLTSEVTVYSEDELGKLTRTMSVMNNRLNEMVGGIRESVIHLASASTQIAVGNADLASRTEQQSAAVVETAASMEQLTSTVKLNADNAIQASVLATSATNDAREGGKVVDEVISTMHGIADSSKQITAIISVINGIAFQTNILALNAAVEAARAGEQGRGFAVVAAEVRNLAQRSASAAKEIETLINNSVSRIVTGTELVSMAGKKMADIVMSITHVSHIISEISTSSNEQSQGIEQIGKAVTEMDATTQQNAALVHESSAAAVSLEHQAESLSQLVSVFKLKKNMQQKTVYNANLLEPKKDMVIQSKPAEGEWLSF
ncbi:MAG: methyl-accepting chemotaxis protein [Rouxiella aceris]|uniref:methyl-accepting chemotaxis protein n=1 Tax=Rouxiella aceris TaxID=2703884 RepID=UPI00284B718E|nr:methyl-accepting chemotaxis protein [Rouxiella aceris]MDR3432756.1 methyl-accepting chemotaxis protein [Rouxiella aceris]